MPFNPDELVGGLCRRWIGGRDGRAPADDQAARCHCGEHGDHRAVDQGGPVQAGMRDSHPGVAVLCVLRPTPVLGVARFYARMLAALAEGGVTGTDAVHAFDTLTMFMFGSVLWEIPRTTDTRERLVAVAIGDEAATQIIERANELSQRDPTEYFEAGLNTILDGLRASRRR